MVNLAAMLSVSDFQSVSSCDYGCDGPVLYTALEVRSAKLL